MIDQRLLQDPSFWIFVSFILLMIIFSRRIIRALSQQLSDRKETITRQINEINNLYEEAKDLLLSEKENLKEKEEEIRLLEIETKSEIERQGHAFKQKTEALQKKYKINLLQKRKDIEEKLLDKIMKNFLEKSCDLAESQLKKTLNSDLSESLIKDRIKNLSI